MFFLDEQPLALLLCTEMSRAVEGAVAGEGEGAGAAEGAGGVRQAPQKTSTRL